MTQREFYTAVIADTQNEDLKAFATEAIAKLDARNAKRASTPSKTQKENEPIIKAIAAVLTSEPMLASEIAADSRCRKQAHSLKRLKASALPM